MPKNPSETKAPETGLVKAYDKVTEAEKRALIDLRFQLQIARFLPNREGESLPELANKAYGELALVENLSPSDNLERMLITQMVAVDCAAMACLARAAMPGQTFEGRELNLKHAERLLSIFTQQLDALNKHRGKGQQKVTVEHVHIQSGAHALIGNVESSAASMKGRTRKTTPPKDVTPSSEAPDTGKDDEPLFVQRSSESVQ